MPNALVLTLQQQGHNRLPNRLSFRTLPQSSWATTALYQYLQSLAHAQRKGQCLLTNILHATLGRFVSHGKQCLLQEFLIVTLQFFSVIFDN